MTKLENKTEAKTQPKTAISGGIDLDKILNSAKEAFSKNEKGLAMQMSTGSHITKPVLDSDYVLYPGEHWKQLTGIKGLPFGKITEIAGKPDSGKSSHAMAFMKEAQDRGYVVILWDAENKFSPDRFNNYFKGNSDALLITTSKVILEGADQVAAMIKGTFKNYPDAKILVSWDSVAGSLSSSENIKNLRESRQMAQSAKEIGMALHNFVHLMEEFKNRETNEEKIAFLLINQVYANVGSVGYKEAGGSKLEYYSSLILQLTRKGDLLFTREGQKRKKGILTRAKVRKNHLFDGEDCISELDLEVTAGGIKSASKKLKEADGAWEEEDSDE
jgi:recombination protein RecA